MTDARIQEASVVLVGSFNPAIFQPAWFAAQGLIPGPDGETARIEIVRPEITIFTAGELRVHATLERVKVSSLDAAQFVAVRDLVLGTFSLLEHTPAKMLGINLRAHYGVENDETWHAIGHLLAPKEPWEGLLEKPGLRTMAMEGKRPGSQAKTLRVQVEPSLEVTPGLYFSLNEHYELEEPDLPALLETLRESWDETMAYYETMLSTLLRRFRSLADE